VLTQLAKGLRVPPELSATLAAELQRLKWFLLHSNVFRSLQTVDDTTTDLEDEDTGGGQQGKNRQDKTRQGGTRVRRVPRRERLGHTQLRGALPRRRDHLHFVVESAVNQVISKRMVKRQQMRWSPRGAHLLLQIHQARSPLHENR